MMKKMILILSITFIIFFVPLIAYAQGAPGDPGDPEIPIDGGVSLLIAAGVAYGGKKIAENRKAKKELKNED